LRLCQDRVNAQSLSRFGITRNPRGRFILGNSGSNHFGAQGIYYLHSFTGPLANVHTRFRFTQAADNDGAYPESIAFVLWGTDNIKTYGESLAQVLWMVGVRPMPDSLGRVNQVCILIYF